MGNRALGVEQPVFTKEAIAAMPDGPIQLIKVDKAGNFSVAEEAKSALRAIGNGKICVVCVTGPSRSGKSALANFLLERHAQDGFLVGSSISDCTRGIWMWGRPRRATLPNGEQCWVLVLDTEGLGNFQKSSDYDTKIFALACLLSSTLLYNSLGSIDEKAITGLSCVAQLVKTIRINPFEQGNNDELTSGEFAGEDIEKDPHEDGEAEDEFDQEDDELPELQFRAHFPNFGWVLRDFSLELTGVNGEEISADEYLESSLRCTTGFDEESLQRNQIRQMLTSFFEERKCFTLCRPLVEESDLQAVDSIPWTMLRPEFQQGLQELKEYLYFHHLKPKTGPNNTFCSASSFVALAEHYSNALSSGSAPTVTSAWNDVMQNECVSMFHEALQLYDSEMEDQIVAELRRKGGSRKSDKGRGQSGHSAALEYQELVNFHAIAVKRAIVLFQSGAYGETAAAYGSQLENALTERLIEHAERNRKSSERSCTEVIQELYESIIAPNLSFGYVAPSSSKPQEQQSESIARFEADIKSLEAKYQMSRRACGPAKDSVLVHFFGRQVLSAFRQLHQALERQRENEALDHANNMKKMNALLHAATAREYLHSSAQGAAQNEAVELRVALEVADKARIAAEERAQRLAADLKTEHARSAALALQLQEAHDALNSERHWQEAISQKLESFRVAYEEKVSDLHSLHAEHTSHKKSKRQEVLQMQKRIEYLEAENQIRAEAKSNLSKALARVASAHPSRRHEKNRQHERTSSRGGTGESRIGTTGKSPSRSKANDGSSALSASSPAHSADRANRTNRPKALANAHREKLALYLEYLHL